MSTLRRKNVRAVCFAVCALVGGMSNEVSAACSQANLIGTWYATGVSGDSRLGGFDSSVRCKITLSSTGAVVASQSNCKIRDDVSLVTVALTAGTVRVTTACAVSGSFVYAGTVRYTIEFGQMGKVDHNMFTFTIYRNANPDVLGVLTAVKQ